MIFDAAEVPPVIEYDVCIVGSGPAAASCLARFGTRPSPLRVAVLESSANLQLFRANNAADAPAVTSRRGRDYSTDVQDIYEGVVTGWIGHCKPRYLRESRVRGFGGSGNAWTGWICPHNDIGTSDSSQLSGWPLCFGEMRRNYEFALSLLGLSPTDLSYQRQLAQTGLRDLPLSVLRRHGFRSTVTLLKAFDFRPQIGRLVGNAESPDLIKNANVVGLNLGQSAVAGCIAHALTASGGRDIEVKARAFILAMGAVETTRLLLASGLSSELPQLGYNFSEHPYLWTGSLLNVAHKPSIGSLHFGAYPHLISDGLWLLPFLIPDREEAAHCDFRFMTCGPALSDLPANLTWEVPPDRLHRLELSPHKRDRLGQRVVQLHTGEDPARLGQGTARRALDAYAALVDDMFHISYRECPPFSAPFWTWQVPFTVSPGNHPSGTCRMGMSPEIGVVDNSCRVHTRSNVWIASSAVFPSAGYANPTLTIMALASRVMDSVISWHQTEG